MNRVICLFALILSACAVDEEGLDMTDETEAAATVPTTITNLTEGEVVQISGLPSSNRYYKIEVPAGYDHVVLYRSGPMSVGADVYVKRGALPSPTSYDCRRMNGTSGVCHVDYPAAGTYYVLVKGAGNNGYTNMSMHVDFQNTYSPIGNNTSLPIWVQYHNDLFFKMAVPAGVGSVTFRFALDDDTSMYDAVDLVVKRGVFATENNFDCIKYIDWGASIMSAACTFRDPPAGTYYVGLIAHAQQYSGTLSASYRYAVVTTTGTATN